MPIFRSPIDLKQSELRNAVLQNLSSDPGSPLVGQLYYKTGDNTLRLYTGAAFVALATGTPSDATTGAKGIVQLAGDLAGTGTAAAAPLIGQVSQLVNGLVGTPSVRFNASASSGLYSSAVNHVSLTANGVQCFDSTSTATLLPLAVTASLGITVTAGGATIAGTTAITGALSTVGGSGTASFSQALTVSAGGAAITGTSSVAGAFSTTGGSGTITSSQALTVSAGGLTVTAGGATIGGTTAITGALSTVGGSGTATFSQALTVSAGGAAITGNSSIAGTLNMNSNVINNVANAVASTDAPNLGQVQALVQGLDVHGSCRFATVGTETFTVAAGTVTVITGTTLDGGSPAIGDRILVKDAPSATGVGSVGSTQPGNGIYTVTNATTNLTIARATDVAGTNSPIGDFTFVEAGTLNASSGWVVSTPSSGAFTYGTNNIAWTQFSGAGEVIAGTGISKSGNTLSIENSGILLPAHGGSGVASPTAHAVLFGAGASPFTNATPTATSGIPLVSNGASADPSFAALNLTASGAVTNALPIANGGTSAITAVLARAALATAAVDSTTLASGATSYTFTPAPAPKTTGAWITSLVNQTTGAKEEADIVINSALNTPLTGPANQITVTFAVATAVNYTLLVAG